VFITLEGIDRSGKTTQAELLARELGPDTVLIREPGGTEAAERIREMLADASLELDPAGELLLFGAARADLVTRVIRPAIDAGRHVVCDRFTDSTVAYQGVGRGLGVERAIQVCRLATDGLEPNVTLLLRIEPDHAADRGGAAEDRFEREGLEFQRAVARAYDEIARREPQRVVVIDAARPIESVHTDVMAAVRERGTG
jgi:dTMP kinase